ncbi:MAG: hypothetical protein JRI25_14460 [Deltaproteobacteria bacterium]|nr:hypothetical protein [Deltaproteobacteria bacterium]
MRALRLVSLLLVIAGCQEPFGSDRHDLEGDRIAAMAVDPAGAPGGDSIAARVALSVDSRPWSDEPVALDWHWLEDDDAHAVADLEPGDDADGLGPAPTLTVPEGEGTVRLALVAAFPSGRVRRAFLDLKRDAEHTPPRLAGLSFAPVGPVSPGDVLTVEATLEDSQASTPMVRWMTVRGRGTFTEQDRLTALWEAAEVVMDDDEVVSRDLLEVGPVTLLALAITEAGDNDFLVEDLWVGAAPTGAWTTSGRWLGSDVAPEGAGPWRGTLRAGDDAPTGLRLEDLTAAPDLTGEDPYGTGALPCTPPVAGPFDPSWLLESRCLRADLDGASVVVEVR